MYNDLHNVRVEEDCLDEADVWLSRHTKNPEGFEKLTMRNQEMIEVYPDNSTESPLERFIFLEELKLVLNAALLLTNKELVVLMMRNYDGKSYPKICDYFYENRGEKLSEYVLHNIEKDALRKVRRKLNFEYGGIGR